MTVKGANRSSARLNAVQALYEMDMVDGPVDPVLRDFMQERWNVAPGDDPDTGNDPEIAEPDGELLADIVRGAQADKAELDEIIEPHLKGDWTMERLEVLLRAILRAGTYELLNRKDVPARVIISEYLDVSHAFFQATEPKLVNGVLDAVARLVRTKEVRDKTAE